MSEAAAQSTNCLLAEKRPNDNCCTWTVLALQVREQLFSPDYSHHPPFQRVHHRRTTVALQGYEFRTCSSFSETRALQMSQVQRFRHRRFFHIYIYVWYTHTPRNEWETAAESSKRLNKKSVRNRIMAIDGVLELCRTHPGWYHFAVGHSACWEAKPGKSDTGKRALDWAEFWGKFDCALQCCTGQTDVCNGWRYGLSLTAVLSKPFSLN